MKARDRRECLRSNAAYYDCLNYSEYHDYFFSQAFPFHPALFPLDAPLLRVLLVLLATLSVLPQHLLLISSLLFWVLAASGVKTRPYTSSSLYL